jgi:hypothetical protein
MLAQCWPRHIFVAHTQSERHLGAAAAIAVMRRKERDVRDVFVSRGVTSPAAATSLDDLGLDEHGFALKRLKRHAVVRESAPGLFSFEEGVWEAMGSVRRRIAFLLLGVLILMGLVLAWGTVSIK